MSVEIRNESDEPVDEFGLVTLGRHVLASMGVHPLVELSIRLVNVDSMERMHVQYMDEPGPTDVMAFPMDELEPRSGPGAGPMYDDDLMPTLLGDVILCPKIAEKQAGSAGHSTEDEM